MSISRSPIRKGQTTTTTASLYSNFAVTNGGTNISGVHFFMTVLHLWFKRAESGGSHWCLDEVILSVSMRESCLTFMSGNVLLFSKEPGGSATHQEGCSRCWMSHSGRRIASSHAFFPLSLFGTCDKALFALFSRVLSILCSLEPATVIHSKIHHIFPHFVSPSLLGTMSWSLLG